MSKVLVKDVSSASVQSPLAAMEITGGDARALVDCFAGVGTGKKSRMAGLWVAKYQFRIFWQDGTSIDISVKTDLTVWSEGQGDWDINSTDQATIRRIVKAARPATSVN